MIKDFLIVGLGGAAGSMARYGIKLLVAQLSLSPAIGTFSVNALGSFLIGIGLATLSEKWLALLLVVGFLGGFTTFSSFSGEAISFFRQGEIAKSFVYVGCTFLVCFIFTYFGFKIGSRP